MAGRRSLGHSGCNWAVRSSSGIRQLVYPCPTSATHEWTEIDSAHQTASQGGRSCATTTFDLSTMKISAASNEKPSSPVRACAPFHTASAGGARANTTAHGAPSATARFAQSTAAPVRSALHKPLYTMRCTGCASSIIVTRGSAMGARADSAWM